ncbi:MAG: Mu-like prophage major head subunit gpT family protein [Phycisphaerae bacterium]|nr:Mu-like prophage major head subunit gpT family protein [Phycisphaerae bacterium]
MNKHAQRHAKARMIRAKLATNEMIRAEAVPVEWIQAADAAPDAPKRFSMVAYTGTAMRIAGYYDPVVVDLAGLKAEAPFPILRDHDLSNIVGHADEAEVAATVKVSGVISGVGPTAAEVLGSAKQGFPWKASIGAMPAEGGLEYVGDGVSTKVNGKTFKGPLTIARKATLREVSFVAVGADGRTSVKVAATAANQKENQMDDKLREWIVAGGAYTAEEIDALRDNQVALIKAAYNAELKEAADKAAIEAKATGTPPAAPKVEPPKFDLAGVVLAYEKHVSGIQAKAASYVGKIDAAQLNEIQAKAGQTAAELKLKALNEEWPVVRLQTELLEARDMTYQKLIQVERPVGPAIHASRYDANPQVIEAAFARACGLVDAEKAYNPEVLEAADKQHKGKLTLQDVLLIHAEAAGCHGHRRIGTHNMGEIIQAAFSTHTLTTLLSTTGNKLLLEGFNLLPQSWRSIAGVRSVPDFKTQTAYRMTSSLEYEEVGPAGEIKHGTLGQESYTMAAKTYGKMITITRQDIINDDLGALNDLRMGLGMGAAIKLNKAFWVLWINNSTFFTAARTNLVETNALGDTGLAAAVAAFRNMAGPDGNLLGLEPDILLVPSTLEATARKFYSSQEIRDTTASTRLPVANIYFNRFRPIVVPELENSAYTGYSASTWYLLCNPAVLPTALVCFLNGQQSPTIESSDTEFNTLGIQMRAYHDWGPAFAEYRAGVKSTA